MNLQFVNRQNATIQICSRSASNMLVKYMRNHLLITIVYTYYVSRNDFYVINPTIVTIVLKLEFDESEK